MNYIFKTSNRWWKGLPLFVSAVLYLTFGGITNAQWITQSPFPTGNNLNAVSFTDPNTGTAVGSNGTILRTSDGGNAWINQSEGSETPDNLVSVSFTDANNGTAVGLDFESIMGVIIRTTDGGNSWIQQVSGTSNQLNGVYFTDSNTGTAVGQVGTILRTTDGGNIWSAQTSGVTANLNGVFFSDANTGTIVGAAGTILRTTDGGTTWSPQTSGITAVFRAVYFSDVNTGTAVGASGNIRRTTDGGTTWTAQTSGVTVLLRALCFADANIGTIVGASGNIRHTTDGGANWTSQASGTTNQLNGVSFKNNSIGTIIGNLGTILHTTDEGGVWTSMTTGVNSTLFGVSFVSADTGTVVGVSGTIARTVDGGSTWTNQVSGTTNQLNAVYFSDANNGTAVGASGTILRTTDGGTTWTPQTSGTTNQLNDVFFTDINTGTVAGHIGTILRTTDGGSTWVPQTSGTTNPLLAVYFSDANSGSVVGFVGTTLRTTDGGTTWAFSQGGAGNTLNDVFFTNANSGIAIGVNGRIFKTTDAGASWISQTSGTTKILYGVSFTDENNGWVSGASGLILRTPDGGTTWLNQFTGATNDLNEISFPTASIGITAGSNGTILRTTNGGGPLFPTAPTNLAAAADTFFVDLSWTDNSTTENGFVLERKDGDSASINPFIPIDTVGSDVTTYKDTIVIPNSTYQYKLYAFNLFGNSGYSNTVQATTFAIAPTTFQLTVNIDSGWNMVSVPGLLPDNQNVTNWWPGKDPAANVFKYSGSYQTVTTAAPSEGYWMKNVDAQIYNTGDEWPAGGIFFVGYNPIISSAGWNLIGGYDYIAPVNGITTNPAGLIEGSIFKYSGAYQVATELTPGYGYWVKLSGPGEIILPSPTFKSSSKLAENVKTDWGKIIVTDNSGKSYILYAVDDELTLSDFDLPPVPPSGIFDVRYSSGRYAEDLSDGIQSIEMSGIEYPVNIKAENVNITLQDETGKQVYAELKSGEQVTVNNSTINKLMILSGEILSPTVYALEQNYPNPFNPATTIKFSLPEASTSVKLTIYNAVGQKVTDLVNSKLDAGNYSYNWDAGNMASGMYIYQIVTEKFVSTKKMMLLK